MTLATESGLRRAAKRQGLRLHKSHCRNPLAAEFGMFHIADENNWIVSGGYPSGFGMSLDEVREFLVEASVTTFRLSGPQVGGGPRGQHV